MNFSALTQFFNGSKYGLNTVGYPCYLSRFFFMCTISNSSPLFLIFYRDITKSKKLKNPLKRLNTIISPIERMVCNYQNSLTCQMKGSGQRKFIPNNANHNSVSQEQHIWNTVWNINNILFLCFSSL